MLLGNKVFFIVIVIVIVIIVIVIVSQLSLCNVLKPDVKSKIKMQLE